MNIDNTLLNPAFILLLCIAAIVLFGIMAYRVIKHIKFTVENNDAKWSYLVFACNGAVTWYLITYENFFVDKFGIVKQFGPPIAIFITIVFLLIFASRFSIKNT